MSGVQSIERAFAVLRALAVGSAGVTDLADRVGLPKSTVSRLLSALEAEGAVEQDEAGTDYRLGPALADLLGASSENTHIVMAARPHLLDLAELANECAGVSVLDGLEVYYLDHVEVAHDVQVRDWTGERAPLHAVPSGLVILANASAKFVDALLASPLESFTPSTVTDPTAIRARFGEIRRRGYEWAFDEFAIGINSVAAPIVDVDGNVRSALHVHGPNYRFPGGRDSARIAGLVVEAADRLSEQLGGIREDPLV